MLSNYLKIAFRTIWKHKGYSLINIIGLALGMACSVLIMLWVLDELSYDRFHDGAETLYRIEEDQHYSGEIFHTWVTPYPAAPVFVDEIPEIVEAARYSWNFSLLIRYGDKAFFEENIRAVDPSFLKLFSFPAVQGDLSTALIEPFSMVITQEIAEKYFPGEPAIGKVISANNKYDFVVKAVLEDVPANSTLQFDMLAPFDFTKEMGWYNEHWGSNSIQTFVRLQEGSDIQAVNTKMTDIVHSRVEESKTDFVLAPFTDMHLHQYAGYGRQAGQVQYIYIFAVVALFVLLLACINFMNLSTARSANRAKEIGMRKVSGALRNNIAGQFLGESLLLAFLALVLAALIVMQVLPVFNTISGKEITATVLLHPVVLSGLLVITIFTGLLAGSYPAFFLSSFRPVSVLKGSLKSGAKSSTLRKVLVVTQFGLSVFLIIGTAVVYLQLDYMKHKDLGYDKEHLLYIPVRGDMAESYAALKSELLKQRAVLAVSASSHPPGRFGSNSSSAEWEGKDPEYSRLITINSVDYDFIEAMKIAMVEGRSFSHAFPSDMGTDSTGAFVINQKLADIMAVKPIIGARLKFMGIDGHVIGVMQDFHYSSVRSAIEPLAMWLAPAEKLRNIVIRIRPENVTGAIDAIRKTWDRVIPQYPLEFSFVDERIDQLYRAEQRMVDILKYFAMLAIIISCLGLFGLASFMAEQRTKEIGIRKALGASVASIVVLMSTEFTKWVVIANLIAWPVAYLVMQGWLEKFAYRVEVGWLVYFMAGMGTILVALLTVSSQAVRSAVSNPADALRYE